jgi:hypothetical protein
MKRARIFFVMMIAAVSLPDANLAAQASPAPQQAVSQSSEKSADQQKDEVRNEKDQARPKESQEQSADVTRTASKSRPASHSKPVQAHKARPARTATTNGARTEAPGSLTGLEPMGSKADTKISNKAVSRRSPSIPSSAVSVNGQQFRNSRDPGAHLAASGGPATTARGTAALNGTDVKRKP